MYFQKNEFVLFILNEKSEKIKNNFVEINIAGGCNKWLKPSSKKELFSNVTHVNIVDDDSNNNNNDVDLSFICLFKNVNKLNIFVEKKCAGLVDILTFCLNLQHFVFNGQIVLREKKRFIRQVYKLKNSSIINTLNNLKSIQLCPKYFLNNIMLKIFLENSYSLEEFFFKKCSSKTLTNYENEHFWVFFNDSLSLYNFKNLTLYTDDIMLYAIMVRHNYKTHFITELLQPLPISFVIYKQYNYKLLENENEPPANVTEIQFFYKNINVDLSKFLKLKKVSFINCTFDTCQFQFNNNNIKYFYFNTISNQQLEIFLLNLLPGNERKIVDLKNTTNEWNVRLLSMYEDILNLKIIY
ncbi:hypothetical protein SGHV012 [Glossina pallidipes salivary gland hypertrophy virus]|uniref:Uncharacterized protein n=1 Tax=Glossina hytrovirus (isolate Glossina pallidipes/Ethiopia/Seibersdorf/-) TaxID=379529 RepID=B0YLG6_GHVS|nr:hypothetical protein SGHV012 [Glossina pallidipes salivary gland hypertrophy virus]ABQ08785.1 hypothetical protein SGHV012 [Glossina pallidipes salivary gland hypertrophy virus]